MRNLSIAVFFLFALSILALGHYFVYASWSNFFSLSESHKKYLGIAFFLLTVGFIASSAFSHYADTFISRSFYELTSTWLGLFSNLFIGTIIAWPLYLLLHNKINEKNLLMIFGVMFVVIILTTIAGYINARIINYRHETVVINNLPNWWQGKKVVQLTDVHLNNTHDELFLEPIIEQVDKEKVAAVFLTGDFFDGMDGNLENITASLKKLQTEKGVYFISGNHETYMGLDKAVKALESHGVKVLLDEKVNVEGLDIAGARFPERDGLRRDLVKVLTDLNVNSPSIFLYHEPRSIKEIADTGRVDLMLSGHTHNGQLWPYNFVVRMIYGIHAIGRHQVGNMTQFTSSGAGTWGPPIRTSARPEVVIFTLEK